MNRRNFLPMAATGFAGVLLFGSKAKAILYADGVHDDTEALNAYGRGEQVYYTDGRKVGNVLSDGVFKISGNVSFESPKVVAIRNCYFTAA